MNLIAPAERFASTARPTRLALCLVAVLLAFLVNAWAHQPIEQALRPGDCTFLDCLRPLRPETRHAGYSAAEFRDFLVATGGLHQAALTALLTDLPLIAAIVAALLSAAGLASRGLPISERSQRILLVLPLAFAAADLIEDGLLVLAYAHLADVSLIVPWVSSLKFGLLVASAVLSGVFGLLRLAQA